MNAMHFDPKLVAYTTSPIQPGVSPQKPDMLISSKGGDDNDDQDSMADVVKDVNRFEDRT